MTNQKRQMTEEIRRRIAELWNQGISSSNIAAEVGLTRNSVIGVSYRARQNGLITKKVKLQKAEKPPKKIVKKEKIVEEIPEPIIELKEYFNEGTENCTLLELKYNSCRFIVEQGNHKTTKYCGKPINRESYCSHHYSLCYTSPRYSVNHSGRDPTVNS
jgi:hypothetical protein